MRWYVIYYTMQSQPPSWSHQFDRVFHLKYISKNYFYQQTVSLSCHNSVFVPSLHILPTQTICCVRRVMFSISNVFCIMFYYEQCLVFYYEQLVMCCYEHCVMRDAWLLLWGWDDNRLLMTSTEWTLVNCCSSERPLSWAGGTFGGMVSREKLSAWPGYCGGMNPRNDVTNLTIQNTH